MHWREVSWESREGLTLQRLSLSLYNPRVHVPSWRFSPVGMELVENRFMGTSS
ncbi:hypothetical protein N665_0511s0016 [Sinapis alba]|nr:hypothetical protein N665_0511s0016 [Sinapis alba]